MNNKSHFSFEKFQHQHEGPLYDFVLARLGRNLHVASLDGEYPSEQLQDKAADVTVEVLLRLYRLCGRENLLNGDTTRTDTAKITDDWLRDELYKTASWLCDGP